MAIFIEMIKIEETDNSVVYAFGDGARLFGKVFLDKTSGEVKLLEIEQSKRQDFYFPRVARKLLQHHKNEEYPGATYYAA